MDHEALSHAPATPPASIRQTPSDASRLGMSHKILVAAWHVAERTRREAFTADALIVECWERHPEAFSLRGFPLPDSNRVLAKLSGVHGLCARRWLERAGPRRLRLTDRGRREARRVLGIASPAVARPRPVALARRAYALPHGLRLSTVIFTESELAALSRPQLRAVLKRFERGIALGEADALALWGVRAPGETSRVVLDSLDTLLTRALEALGGDARVDPRVPPASVCAGLRALHRMLRQRFAPEAATPIASVDERPSR